MGMRLGLGLRHSNWLAELRDSQEPHRALAVEGPALLAGHAVAWLAFGRQWVQPSKKATPNSSHFSTAESSEISLANLPCFPANFPLWRQK